MAALKELSQTRMARFHKKEKQKSLRNRLIGPHALQKAIQLTTGGFSCPARHRLSLVSSFT